MTFTRASSTGIFVRKTWEDFPLPAEQLGAPIRDVTLFSPARRPLKLTADHDEFRCGRMEWIYLYMLEQCARADTLASTRYRASTGGYSTTMRYFR